MIKIKQENGTLITEYENPPFIVGEEYRTTERIKDKAVYKRMTSDGVVEYHLEGETDWKNYAVMLGAAPYNFGLGETTPPEITTTEQLDETRACGFYRYKISGSKICGMSFTYASMIVYSLGPNSCTQELRPINTNYCLRRFYYHGTWSEWELVGGVQMKLWANASRTSTFAPQTLSLDLSGYDEVLIYSCLEASKNNDYMVVSRCPIGERALAHFTWADDGVSLHRFAKTSKTGIEFFDAYHGGGIDNASMMPYLIYGIKGVSK